LTWERSIDVVISIDNYDVLRTQTTMMTIMKKEHLPISDLIIGGK